MNRDFSCRSNALAPGSQHDLEIGNIQLASKL